MVPLEMVQTSTMPLKTKSVELVWESPNVPIYISALRLIDHSSLLSPRQAILRLSKSTFPSVSREMRHEIIAQVQVSLRKRFAMNTRCGFDRGAKVC